MIRKTIVFVISKLNAFGSGIGVKYKNCLKLVKGSLTKEVANRCVADFAASLKSIRVTIVGKAGIDKDFLKDLVSLADGAIPDHGRVEGKKEKSDYKHHPFNSNCHTESGSAKGDKKETPHVSAKGLGLVVTNDYIASVSGMISNIYDGKIYISSNTWESKKKAIGTADRISRYVDQKYTRVGETMNEALVRHIASVCCGEYSIVKAALNVGAKEVTTMIKNALA
jgi:hypothetical protein